MTAILVSNVDADLESAEAVFGSYGKHRTIREWFEALGKLARIGDGRLEHADNLRKCLAFDAILAWRAFDVRGTEPDLPLPSC